MVPEEILFDTSMTSTLRLVYAAVALHADQETGKCFFNQGKLAARLGMTRETLNRHLRRLADAGHLEIISRTASDRGYEESNRRTHSDYVLRTRVPRTGKLKKTSRQAGYEIADSVNEMGTNFRPGGLRGRESHMVASAAAGAIASGMSEVDAHDAMVELVNEYPTLPTTADVIERGQEVRDLRAVVAANGPARDPWSMY